MSNKPIQKNTNDILTLSVPLGFAVCAIVALKTENFMLGGIAGAVVAAVIILLAMLYKETALKKVNNDNTTYNENKSINVTVDICPRCGSKLIIKNGKHGKFSGCSSFPKCRFTKGI